MNGVPMVAYLGLGLFMFTVGVIGVIIRRNPIVIFMCIELMLNSVNLTFLTFAKYSPAMANTGTTEFAHSVMQGQMMVIFVMAVAAAEVAVGLGIIMAIYRLRNTVDIDEMNLLRG
jgi:NADH-quinone oxidoreductase subunit K